MLVRSVFTNFKECRDRASVPQSFSSIHSMGIQYRWNRLESVTALPTNPEEHNFRKFDIASGRKRRRRVVLQYNLVSLL